MLPVSLQILGAIALVLHILFTYFLDPTNNPTRPAYFKPIVSLVVIIVILLLWFVLPVRVGG